LLVRYKFGPIDPAWWSLVENDDDFGHEPKSRGEWVLWIPRLMEGSTYKTVEELKPLPAQFASSLNVPIEWVDFGSAIDLAYLLLLNYLRTGVQTYWWARSSNRYGPNSYIGLGFSPVKKALVAQEWLAGARANGLGICPIVYYPSPAPRDLRLG